ncbi:hypothetical protein BDZ94DRAFT_1260726 [Collybia nuda]|uniref:Pheromone n=1 Tax=Collybia nuda TaxID=64659 RepID=A0A9P5Y3R9_9AGAR|nr:hypothetical protein BDZ94DRAFT_1260726 [Collybia nuda]
MDAFSTISFIFTPSLDVDVTPEHIATLYNSQPRSVDGTPLVDADRPSGDYGSFCTIA